MYKDTNVLNTQSCTRIKKDMRRKKRRHEKPFVFPCVLTNKSIVPFQQIPFVQCCSDEFFVIHSYLFKSYTNFYKNH